MMVSWHNWKLKLKRYWFSVWCWWSKWKDASWSQCDFPGRSTEDPGRSKSGVAAPQDIWRSAPCAPRLALSRMVSPPPPTMRQKTVRFFSITKYCHRNHFNDCSPGLMAVSWATRLCVRRSWMFSSLKSRRSSRGCPRLWAKKKRNGIFRPWIKRYICLPCCFLFSLLSVYVWVHNRSNMPMFCLKKLISQPWVVQESPSLAQMTFTQCTSMSELKFDSVAPPGGQI